MTDPTNAVEGTRETFAEATKDESSTVRLWLDAIQLASKEEETWRKQAEEAFKLYRQSAGADNRAPKNKFNILHSNIETLKPALYNSTPIPDVRRRYGDSDPVAKTVADIQERCLSYSVESYDFDHTMKLAVSDMEIAGRAVDRVRFKPYLDKDDNLAYQEVVCEQVAWDSFRRGPAKLWDDVPWIAFELFLTREELVKLSPQLGKDVSLDVTVNDKFDKQDKNVPEVFKRARVWEIWDKDHQEVLFIAESYKEKPLVQQKDPLDLEGFYPIPRPLYSIETSNSLVPIVPYEMYRAQAEELEEVSERIITLTKAVKAKSLYDGRLTEMDRLERADDTDSIAVENLAIFADGSKLADHVMFYPIEIIVAALEKLYIARDQIKQTIYEITGIADILRGETNPNETLGAQQIKTQWGSLRIQNKQADVARYARDIFRIKAELFCSKFEPQVLEMITGIPLMPQQGEPPEATQQKAAVLQLLKTDRQRSFRVDVESDSTIRADLTRNQQNMNMFLQGTAQFAQAMGPIVMQFKQMTPAVMTVFSAFARNFKLGKQAEDALEKTALMAEQMANQPEQPSPQQQAEQAKAEAEKAKMQMDMQAAQQKHGMEMEKMQAELQMKQQELQMKERELAMKERALQLDAQSAEHKAALESDAMTRKAQIDRDAMEHKALLTERTAALQAEGAERKHELGLEVIEVKAAQAKQRPQASK